MKLFTLLTVTMLLIGLGTVKPVSAEEYYVIKSRSGVVRVVDHKPKGNATIVKGPFKTREEAEKALTPSIEPKTPNLKPKQGKTEER